MAKQGMKRPDRTKTKERNNVKPVPELQGKEKTGKKSAGNTVFYPPSTGPTSV